MLKRLDYWWGLVIGLALLAALPLLENPGLPNGSDVLYHTYRVGEMARSWANGMPFPRWAEGLYFGYGSPLWHFYASFTYYITTIFVRYLGFSALDALRIFIVLCYLLMSSSMYLFMKQQAGRIAGVLGAAAYLYAPYILYTEPYARGVYPELYALALFPLVLWRIGALLQVPSGFNMATVAVTTYLLAVAHNLMAITLTLLLLGWLAWNTGGTYFADRGAWRWTLRPYLLAFVSITLGLGLSGYFWIPVLLEGHTVNLENLTGVALLDYRNFFVPLAELLQPMPINDLGAINGLRNVTVLGLFQWIGALGGLGATLWAIRAALKAGRHDDRLLRQGVYFGLAALALVALITPSSRFIWDALRPLQFLQFPWRLLGPLAFLLAFLVGLNVLWIARLPRVAAGGAVGVLLMLLVVPSLPALSVPEWIHREVDTSIAAYHQSEVAGLQRGTTFTDEYRPRSVFTLPGPVPRILEEFAAGGIVNKANVPDGVIATPTLYTPVWLEWVVFSEEGFTMEVYTFYWEGWRAAIDNRSIEITPSPEHGLITFDVPPGGHLVRVFLGTTPPRLGGNLLSTVSLGLLLAFVALRVHKLRRYADPLPEVGAASLPVVAGAVAIIVVLGIARPEGVFYRNTPPGEAPAQHRVQFNVGEGAQVIGYDLNATEFRAGDTVRVVVYWFPTQPATINYSSFVHIGMLGLPPLAQQDKLHPADRVMTQWWQPIGYLYDEYLIRLPDDMPAGEYDVIVGLYTCETLPEGECGSGDRPTVTAADGTILGDVLPLTRITVR